MEHQKVGPVEVIRSLLDFVTADRLCNALGEEGVAKSAHDSFK